MLALLGSKQKSLVGIDIGSSSVKVIELARKGSQYIIESYAQESIPENAVDGKIIKAPQQVSDVIRLALEKAKTKTKRAAIAVPDSSVISKVIQLEIGLTDDETEELVMLEADKYIPYPIDEVSIDFQVMNTSEKNDSMQDILVVASRTENVNARVDIIKDSGLDVQVVDVESYAIERGYQLFEEDSAHNKSIAIFDIGEMITQLTVLRDSNVIFSRDEVFGGKQLTDDLMKRYSMTIEQARLAKKTGKLPDDYTEEVLEPFKEMVGLQVRRALQFFFSTSQYSEIDMIMLAGGSSHLPGMVEKVSEVMGSPTVLVNPVAKMDVARGVDKNALMHDASALMVACGLAMRQFE